MSISYSLDMAATEKTVLQVAWQMCDVARSLDLFGASVTPELLVDEGAVTTTGLWLRVGEERSDPRHPVLTDLGFSPNVSVMFELARSSEQSDQQDEMIRLASRLLERVAGDAVLHFQFEVIWLLRRSGEMSLNERDDLWPPRRLAVVSRSYRRTTHVFSDE